MGLPDSSPKSLFSGRDNNQMHMIRHEAIGPNRDGVARAPLSHEVNVGAVVRVIEEGPLSPVSSLRDVVRSTRDDNSGDPCHRCSLLVALHLQRMDEMSEFQNPKRENSGPSIEASNPVKLGAASPESNSNKAMTT